MFQIFLHFFPAALLRNPPAPLRVMILMLAVLCYGTTGFLYFELEQNPALSWLDAFWYTLVTMTTVGYGDFFPKSTGGRLLIGIPVMVFGIGLLGYALSLIAAALVNSKTREIRGMADYHFQDHLLILNYPGLAKVMRVLQELRLDSAVGQTTVILIDETLEELPLELRTLGVHFVRGHPARDHTLQRANVDQARHAVILSRHPADPASDHLNLAIVLAIEARNRRVNTVVECVDSESEELLRKAGSDRIVCNSRFDACLLTQELLNPGIQEVFGELLSATQGQQFYCLSIRQAGTFQELAARCRQHGHLALGILEGNHPRLNPEPETPVSPTARLITIGARRLDEI